MQIVNLTPHDVVVQTPDGARITYVRGEGVARVATRPAEPYEVKGLPVSVLPTPTYGDVVGLPPPRPGVAYIVSLLVLQQCKGRADVFAPATGPSDGAIRAENGQIEAVTRFVASPHA